MVDEQDPNAVVQDGDVPDQAVMLPYAFDCPKCGKSVPHGSKVGVEVACPHCGERTVVPAPIPEAT